jgi:hypothetical protein
MHIYFFFSATASKELEPVLLATNVLGFNEIKHWQNSIVGIKLQVIIDNLNVLLCPWYKGT